MKMVRLKVFTKEQLRVNSASLGRVWQHIQKKSVPSWGILTSYRDEKTAQENKKDFKALQQAVKKHGYFKLEGHGQEEDDEGNVAKVVEPSLFIPNISLKEIQNLSDKYNQYGFIYSGPETKDKIVLFSIEGKSDLGKFHPNKISQFFSKIKNKPFIFASVTPYLWDKPSGSNMERYGRSLKGYQEPVTYNPKIHNI